MKKIILLLFMMIAMTPSVFSERQQQCLSTHQKVSDSLNCEDRDPINLPISVYYDSETNILEVWCADDIIQAESFDFDESDAVKAYSPCMMVLTSSDSNYIPLIDNGWEAEGFLSNNCSRT